MKRLFGFVAVATVFMAVPLLAQDDLGGFFGGGGDNFLIDAPAPAAGGNRGAANRGGARGGPQQPAVDRLVSLKGILVKENAPLTADQEKALNALLDTEIPAMQTGFRTKFASEIAALEAAAASAPPAGAPGAGPGGQGRGQGTGGGQGRGAGAPGAGQPAGPGAGQGAGLGPGQGRGGGAAGAPGAGAGQGRGGAARGGAPTIPPDSPMAAEMRRMNDDLLNKIITVLTPAQKPPLQKMLKDQVRARGLYDLGGLRIILEEAGAPPLTDDQSARLDALFLQRSESRYALTKAGPADAAQLAKIDGDTISKLLAVLNAGQKKAFADSMTKARQQQ